MSLQLHSVHKKTSPSLKLLLEKLMNLNKHLRQYSCENAHSTHLICLLVKYFCRSTATSLSTTHCPQNKDQQSERSCIDFLKSVFSPVRLSSPGNTLSKCSAPYFSLTHNCLICLSSMVNPIRATEILLTFPYLLYIAIGKVYLTSRH